MDGNRKKVGGCTLGSYALDVKCEDCSRCGWNPAVDAERKRNIRRGVIREKERVRLTAARKTAVPDRAGWYNARRALPDPGERVIVTDGVFVGEAYLSKGGVWLRHGDGRPADRHLPARGVDAAAGVLEAITEDAT